MSDPQFTVLIALYNKEPFIRRTLQSALAQSYPAAEILIVDDGSTDNSVERIADLIGGKVRLVRQTNAGPGPARNRGFAEARHEWVALLDADDLWLPDHLASLADVIRRFPAAAAVNTASDRAFPHEIDDLKPRPSGNCDGYAHDYFGTAGTSEAMWSSSVAIRREAFANTGGYGAFWPGEDVELFARLALQHSFAGTRKVTSVYLMETGGLMDQGGGTRFGAGEEPEYLVLQAALADPRYADKHASIRAYRNRVLRLRVRQALYDGDNRKARAFLHLLGKDGRSGMLPYRLGAMLPNWFIRLGVAGYRRAKQRRARRAA